MCHDNGLEEILSPRDDFLSAIDRWVLVGILRTGISRCRCGAVTPVDRQAEFIL
jgi:hypothetical protein